MWFLVFAPEVVERGVVDGRWGFFLMEAFFSAGCSTPHFAKAAIVGFLVIICHSRLSGIGLGLRSIQTKIRHCHSYDNAYNFKYSLLGGAPTCNNFIPCGVTRHRSPVDRSHEEIIVVSCSEERPNISIMTLLYWVHVLLAQCSPLVSVSETLGLAAMDISKEKIGLSLGID